MTLHLRHTVKLLPRTALVKTGPVDYADWNFRPIWGQIQRLRFSLALSLLPRHSRRLLEIGYGSGIFMPSLAEISDELYGIETHSKASEIKAILRSNGINADLRFGRAEALPFADSFFDSVVAISSLEFVSDLQLVCEHVRRVLKSDASFVVVTPSYSPIADFGLKILTGNSAKRDFGNRREIILPTLLKNFTLEKRKRFAPPFFIGVGILYDAVLLRK